MGTAEREPLLYCYLKSLFLDATHLQYAFEVTTALLTKLLVEVLLAGPPPSTAPPTMLDLETRLRREKLIRRSLELLKVGFWP